MPWLQNGLELVPTDYLRQLPAKFSHYIHSANCCIRNHTWAQVGPYYTFFNFFDLVQEVEQKRRWVLLLVKLQYSCTPYQQPMCT